MSSLPEGNPGMMSEKPASRSGEPILEPAPRSSRAAKLSTLERYVRTPRPPPPARTSTRGLHLSISVLILGFVVLYAQRQKQLAAIPPVDDVVRWYGVGQHRLPNSYAICTPGRTGVYTVPHDREDGVGERECVVAQDGWVVDTGSLNKVRRKWVDSAGGSGRSGIKIFHLPPGHTMTAGLIDAHGHVLEHGYYAQLPLLGCRSPAEVVSRVEAFVRAHLALPANSWIEGMGWDQNLFPSRAFPTAHDLEQSPVLRGKKICLARVDVHAMWVSRAILDELESRPGGLPLEVEGGVIVRDEEGKPTGVFLDNAIIQLLDPIRPPWTDEQRSRFLDHTGQEALSKGLTGVHNARTFKSEVDFFRAQAESGTLPFRLNLMISCALASEYCGDSIPQMHASASPGGRLQIRSVKLFADGALGSRGAALLDDYADQPGWKGLMLTPEGEWEGIMRKWYDQGWQVNVHTIGDRANHVILNAIEGIVGPRPGPELSGRFRLEHAQIMTPDDLKRAVRLGVKLTDPVIASYQPTHATSDMWYAEARLGKDRLKGAYAWQSYLSLGGRIALGSDFPVESLDSLKGIYAAVTRLSEDGRSPAGPGGWIPEERLTRQEALRGFTADAAYAGLSNTTGSLVPGYRFDAVIWDDDLMAVPVDEMLQVRVKGTIMDGNFVWGGIEL